MCNAAAHLKILCMAAYMFPSGIIEGGKMKQNNITVDDVADGLVKLIREVRTLQGGVADVKKQIAGFRAEAKVSTQSRRTVPPAWQGASWQEKPETDEPNRFIQQVRWEMEGNPDLTVTAKIMSAMAKELDGALRDIQGIRRDMSVIATEDDLKDEFRAWQERQSG